MKLTLIIIVLILVSGCYNESARDGTLKEDGGSLKEGKEYLKAYS